MAVRKILLLGNPELLRTCTEVRQHELILVKPIIRDLFDTMAQFQADHGWGRAIAQCFCQLTHPSSDKGSGEPTFDGGLCPILLADLVNRIGATYPLF